MKSSGVQPGQVTPTLIPIQEMGKFYEAGRRTLLSNQSPNVVTNGYVVSATVPGGKIWLVEEITAESAILGAVATCQLQVVIADQTNAAHLFRIGNPSPVGASGSILLANMDGPMVLLPGYTIGFIVTAPAAVSPFAVLQYVWGAEVNG